MKPSEWIDRQFIDPIDRSKTMSGIEVELPIVPFNGGRVSDELSKELFAMMCGLGFTAQKYTNSGKIFEVSDRFGNSVSYETTWNTLEFSLKKKSNLIALYNTYIEILVPVQRFCMGRGYYLCGRGINPNYRYMDTSPLDTDNMLTKAEYLTKYTEHHDGEIFHALCASVQTHLDALDKPSYLKMLRLLRRAYVFDALFFANSLPPEEDFIRTRPALSRLERDTLCYRDELWKYCGAPNTAMIPARLDTTDDLRTYLSKLKLFIAVHDGKYEAIRPILPEDYCAGGDIQEEMLTFLRSMEPVAPTKRGTVEIRSTCVQPLDAMLEPASFYTGLVAEADEAEKLIGEIYETYFHGLDSPQIRNMLMRRSAAPLRYELKEKAGQLIGLSLCGLKKRSFGEEKLLEDLPERMKENGWRVPAECTEDDALAQTKHQMEIIERKYFQ